MKAKLIIMLFFLSIFSTKAQDFYDINTIQEIKVYLDVADWQFVLNKNEYYQADSIKINGTKLVDVGIKYKGNSSFDYSFSKNPFHIELDTYVSQNYQGYKDIKLSNVFYDPSFIRETLSYNILNQYMASPRANYAKFYMNDVFIGLYVNTESITKKFVNDKFGSSENTFIKGAQPIFNWNSTHKPNLVYLGNDIALYQLGYELKSETGWEDLVNLTNVLNNNTANIETVLDVDATLWMLAFNNVLVNLDSYSGYLNHNYYLYKDNNGRFIPIVWDLNMSFGTFDYTNSSSNFLPSTSSKIMLSPSFQQDNPNWPLIKKLLDNPSYKKQYLAKMKTIVNENFVNNTYLTKANSYKAMIDATVVADTNKFYPYLYFQYNITNDIPVHSDFVATAIQPLMDGRKNYLLSLPEFTAAEPLITNISLSNPTPSVGTNFNITAQVTNTNANSVYIGHRNNTNGIFVKTQMFDDGLHNDGAAGDNVYGTTLLMENISKQYYIYAENNTIGVFSPKRAAYEFHSIQGTYPTIEPGQITINEIMAQNTSTVTDPAGQYEDWIELYNNTNTTLSLDNLFMTDTTTNMQKWQFPTGLTLAPNSYLIVWADEDLTEEGIHANFKLSAGGESVILSYPNGTIIDNVPFGVQTANISYARNPNGTGNFVLQAPTFNGNNESLSAEAFSSNYNFKVWPNPVTDILNIYSDYSLKKINVYNLLGQPLLTKEFETKDNYQIDLSHLPKGTYLITIENDSKKSQALKIIKN